MASVLACCGHPENILKEPENIPTNYTYLIIDFCTVLVPFVFSFHPALCFYKTWNYFFPANLIVGLVFIAWDFLFVHFGVWGFNSRYLCGLSIYTLPIEEILFFFCIPYASLFTYHCLKQFIKAPSFPSRTVSAILIPGLFITAIAFIPRFYTSVTFLSLSFVLYFVTFGSKQTWISYFYISFLLLLIPFFIVNGLLTGSFIQEPVVWYNDRENLGLRLFTVPFEDLFYGMLLLILNIWLYERFSAR